MGNAFDIQRVDLTQEVIDLRDRGINSQAAIDLAKQLQNSPKLKCLYLGINDIGTNGARGLSELVLRHPSLKVLDLSSNRISDNGATLLAAAIQSSPGSLEELHLAHNSITDVGARRLLMAAMHISSLSRIDITSNRVTNSGLTHACANLSWARSEFQAGRLDSSIDRSAGSANPSRARSPSGLFADIDDLKISANTFTSFSGSTLGLALPGSGDDLTINSTQTQASSEVVPAASFSTAPSDSKTKQVGIVSATLSNVNLIPPSTPVHSSTSKAQNRQRSTGRPPQIPNRLDLNQGTELNANGSAASEDVWSLQVPHRVRRAESAYQAPTPHRFDDFKGVSPVPSERVTSGESKTSRVQAKMDDSLQPQDLFPSKGSGRKSDIYSSAAGLSKSMKTAASGSFSSEKRSKRSSKLGVSMSFSGLDNPETRAELQQLREEFSQKLAASQGLPPMAEEQSSDPVPGTQGQSSAAPESLTSEQLAALMKERRRAERKDFLEKWVAARNQANEQPADAAGTSVNITAQTESSANRLNSAQSQPPDSKPSVPPELPASDVVNAWALRNTVTPMPNPSAVFVSSMTYKSAPSKPKPRPYLPYLLRTLHEVYPLFSSSSPLLPGPLHEVPPVSQLRMAYRTAILSVHPDRVPLDAPPRLKELATCIFPILKAAYDQFMETVNPNDS